MRRLHTGVFSALALVLGISAAQADAQSLRGFRAEGQVGITSFHSEGNHKSKIGWGAAVGVDAYLADTFVLDVADAALAPEVESLGLRPVITETLMVDPRRRAEIGRLVLEALA